MLYSAFGGRGNPYGWTHISLTLADLDRAKPLLEADQQRPEAERRYQNDAGQLRLARELGINSLSHLYSAFGGRGNPYGWTHISLTLADLDRATPLLAADQQLPEAQRRYQGDAGQLRL